MKRSIIRENGLIAIGLLILIQITTTVCLIKESYDGYSITIEIRDMNELPADSFKSESSSEGSDRIPIIVYMANNSFTTIHEDTFNNLTEMDTLTANHNQLATLPENIFYNLTQLEIVNLNENQFKILPEKFFHGLTKLHKISLSENYFTELPENIFQELGNLSDLDLSKNQFTTIPEHFFAGKKDLKKLNLSSNKVKALPETIFNELTSLEELCLVDNQLITLPENIFQSLRNLSYLDLSKNQITTLPADIFKGQPNLYTLLLSQNQITILPADVFKSQLHLFTLLLNQNRLTKLSEYLFAATKDLKTLDLSRNQILTLPENIFNELTDLGELFLGDNQLTTLPENIFQSLRILSYLDLSRNHFTTLPADIFKGQPYLRTLLLNQNQLTSFSANIFRNQTESYLTLNLTKNHLTSFPENIFDRIRGLSYLYVSENHLTSLPESIFWKHNLMYVLDLSGNRLQTLPEYIFRDQIHLRGLNLDGNPWVCDNEFLNVIQSEKKKHIHINYDEILCVDGQSVGYTRDSSKASEFCLPECNCSMPKDKTSFVFNCSSNNLKNIPSGLNQKLRKTSEFREIVLNLDNNNFTSLPNLSTLEYNLITNLSVKNNSITSIDVDNLPLFVLEMDLSDNKLESLSTAVIRKLSDSIFLEKLVLAGNPWTCDDVFFDFVRFNKERVDFENITCNDGELLHLKHNRLVYWITDETEDVIRPEWANSNKMPRKIKHEDDYGQICPPECNCLIERSNTTISYKCSPNDFSRILNHFYNGKQYWQLMKHRLLIF